MAKKPFSVSDYIKPEDVSKLDTEATAISFIPRERLLQNEKNFYDASSIGRAPRLRRSCCPCR